MATPVTDVFLSYKAEDEDRLRPLIAALQAEGFSVWWDAQIRGGANWREDIQAHLDAARCVIVAWTKRSVGRQGNFVRDEAGRAQRLGTYLPIRLDNVEPPLGFGEVQLLCLKGWKGERADPRFEALVRAVRARISGDSAEPSPLPLRAARVSRRAVVIGGTGAAAAAIAGAGGWMLLKPDPANARRIAVLPFANLSGDPQEDYFAAGIAEELRASLNRLGMQVIGRTSSDAVKDLDTTAAAAKLDVANILTGSVRRSAQMIRVNAQLVGGSDGVERWGQSYDRAAGDAIKIQADIAQNVAQALSIALGRAAKAAIALGGTADPVAQDLVMRARRMLATSKSEKDARQAIALADAAIARDPDYAGAYVAKAFIHRSFANAPMPPAAVSEQISQALAAARRAISLAPDWGIAYFALAAAETARLNFAGALRTARRALSLSPDSPEVVTAASYNIALYEDVNAGLRLADHSIRLDPLRGQSHLNKASLLNLARKFRQAVEVGRQAETLNAIENWVHVEVGSAYLFLGEMDRARAEFERIEDTAMKPTQLALLAARTGKPAEARALLARMKQEFGAATAYQHAEILAQLSDVDGAFEELDAAVKRRDSGLAHLKVDPFLDPIRKDARYAALLRRLNYP